MAKLVTFDRRSAEMIARQVRRGINTPANGPPLPMGNHASGLGNQFRFGVTATDTDHPTYPTGAADSFLVTYQDWKFDDQEPGEQSIETTDWGLSKVARNFHGQYVPEGTAVLVWRMPTPDAGFRYWFIPVQSPMVAFRLEEDVASLGAFPVNARLLDNAGETYGGTIQVTDSPVMNNVWGPAAIGFDGFATRPAGAEESDPYVIVTLQRFAEYIEFAGASFSPTGSPPCQSGVTVASYWRGEDPTAYGSWAPKVDASRYTKCDCYSSGVAVLDDRASVLPDLLYRIVDVEPLVRDIIAGDGITISGSCDKTISADGPSKGIEAGECIELDESGETTVINSTVEVIGGDGIEVQKSQCSYSISLAGKEAGETTAIQFVCDVNCVEVGESWQLQIKYGTLTLPTSLITLDSECAESRYTCDDCDNCESNETKILKDDGSECDCIAEGATIPAGWSECPDGVGIAGSATVDGINCPHDSPSVTVTIHWVPTGATQLVVTSTGMLGSPVAVGTIASPTAGQSYYCALVQGWGDPQTDECFSFSLQWKDAAGTAVGTPITSNDWCC